MNDHGHKKGRVICCGTVLNDCIVTRAGTADVADDISIAPEGERFNGATALAHLGEDVTLIAAVGNDFAGEASLRAMESHSCRDMSEKRRSVCLQWRSMVNGEAAYLRRISTRDTDRHFRRTWAECLL